MESFTDEAVHVKKIVVTNNSAGGDSNHFTYIVKRYFGLLIEGELSFLDQLWFVLVSYSVMKESESGESESESEGERFVVVRHEK